MNVTGQILLVRVCRRPFADDTSRPYALFDTTSGQYDLIIILFTGKNPTYAQAKIKLFAHNTVYCVKAAFSCFCCLRVELENKEYHHGGFQQQSPQRLIYRYEYE